MIRSVPAPLHPAINLSRSFAQIIDAICRAIAARAAKDAARGALLVLLWSRLRRLAKRLARVADRVAAGTLDTLRQHAVAGEAIRPTRGRTPAPWPRGLCGLARLAPEAACYGSQLRALLARPEVAALLAATPRLGRYVRPLCRLLGVDPAPPPPQRQTRAEAPAATDAPAPRSLAGLPVPRPLKLA